MKLTQKKRKEAGFNSSQLVDYKNSYVCKKCGIVYGSDKKDKTKLCPKCRLAKLRRKK